MRSGKASRRLWNATGARLRCCAPHSRPEARIVDGPHSKVGGIYRTNGPHAEKGKADV